ncbi:MAG: M6 family metalloprotease domain-containing protein [Chloroflexota bacterium]
MRESIGKLRVSALVVLTSLILAFGGEGHAGVGADASADGVPPNPRLLERIARGQVRIPRVVTNRTPTRLRRAPASPHALTGTVRALAVLVDFSDKASTVSANYFDALLFAAPVAGRGSVRDYFDEVSYGQIDLVTLDVPSTLGWLRAPSTYAYYVNNNYCDGFSYPNNCQKLAEDLVDALHAAGVNFANYDNDHDGYAEPVIIIHAGTGAEVTGNPNDVWSHSWGLAYPRSYDGVTIDRYTIQPEYWQEPGNPPVDMTIGVFAHEMGHGFWNLPDLYDTDLSSLGIGNWSLMSYGVWNGPARWGDSPAWLDAWSRIRMGIATFTNVTSNVGNQNIPQAYNNPLAQTILRLHSTVLASQEYFLLENRQQVSGSYDEYLPGNGLLIWHVDESMSSNDLECTLEPHSLCPSNHYLVALEQADGARHLEYGINGGDTGDPFPGATNNRNWWTSTHPESSSWYSTAASCIGVTNIGDSGASMSADLQVTCLWYFLPRILKWASP